MKNITMSICDINLTSGSRHWTNQTLISSWHRHNNRRYPAERYPPGSYTTLVSATIMPRLYCSNWKLKLQVSFSQLLLRKIFVKLTSFPLVQVTRKSMTNMLLWQSWLCIFYKYWHSINVFCSRTYKPEA